MKPLLVLPLLLAVSVVAFAAEPTPAPFPSPAPKVCTEASVIADGVCYALVDGKKAQKLPKTCCM